MDVCELDSFLAENLPTDTCNNTYKERNSGINKAEEKFEAFCKSKGMEFHRFGFDEKGDPVSKFYILHPYIRGLPDYIIVGKKIYFVHVKGTNKFKLIDLIGYSAFENLFCTEKSALRVAFFIGDSIKFKSMKDIREMLTGLAVEEFPSDRKQYFSLPL